MKISDLTEYNKGEAGDPVDINRLNQLKQSGEFLVKFNRNSSPVNIFKTIEENSVWFIFEYQNNIIGYFRTEILPSNYQILQVKDEQIFSQFQNQGIGTEAYIILSNHGGLRFIHDTQLSDHSEHMWKNKLLPQHVVKGIYDRARDKVYPLDAVGQLDDYGDKISSPDRDTSDPVDDYDGSLQRWFWILESKRPGQPIIELLEAHQSYYKHGHDLLYINQQQYNRSRMTPKVLLNNTGF